MRRGPHRTVARSALACAVTFTSTFAPAMPFASATDPGEPIVIADDDRDVYVGTGGLVLPRGSADETLRRSVAECPGCRWRLREPCASGTDAGPCLSVSRGCPAGGRHLRTWHSRDGGRTWADLGVACYPPVGPVTVEGVTSAVADRVEEFVPPGSISAQPPRGAVPHLPIAFAANQPADLGPLRLEVAGRTLEVRPRATWQWSFGDGARLTTDRPGGRYPDLSVAHAYRASGRYEVVLDTAWTASYTLDGFGPFPVDPIRQRTSARIVVRPALGVLVP